ncbi:MAG: methylenetetrahydrofolate reductase [Proteobacteria bacterium]|nr:5,10-methylenetetrahydrofolate reductase [Desulfobacula sp.]MBU3953591.1 methylenetetrahydrofolate reductase [Pseudomonadota bacterium]MBU4130243.1 methylenetetrahydrofolate reductase [Pseudomonadota bacterium]
MSFQAKLSSGEFAVLAEMNTPKGIDISELITNVRYLKSRIDTIVIPDMDNGVMHMSALAGGALMRQQGIEPLIHVYGRDRNRMALQGDLLAAHVLGIHNLLVVQGEDMANGDHQDAVPVNDLDEIALLRMVGSLTRGSDMAGFELKGTPEFTVGCAIAPIADAAQLKQEVEAAKKKIDAGAQYLLLPPVFDSLFYTQMIEAFKALKVPVIASVFLLKNVGMARYISINDPNSRLSEDTIRRIRKAKDRENECISIAGEMIRSLKKVSQGVKISALGWEDRLPAILDSAGL